MREKILIVDDDIQIGNLIEDVLTRADYKTLRAYSGTEALLLLAHETPDLILLDLMLPGLSGEEVLPKFSGIPVIILSAKIDVQDKVDLLLGGAADYITKELRARIAVQLRRPAARRPAQLVCGELAVDTAARTTCAAGRPVQLTKTEYAILKLLMENPGQVIAKSIILDRIADDTPDCTESSLKTHMSHLRAKLRQAGGKDYIEAVWGIGFKLADC